MTAKIGYHLSSEEHPPVDLVRNAAAAEEAGFDFAFISDHYHPWIRAQGHAPFVWSVLGAIATSTDRMQVGTAVTAPIVRIHPAVVAQAAATVACMMPDRFFLGVGTGEFLNEHVTGASWPHPRVRLKMLSEAMEVMRRLWSGDRVSHRGDHYEVDRTRIFDVPETPPPIMVAASGRRAAKLAGKKGDGLISVTLDRKPLEAFEEAGGAGKPRYLKVGVVWDPDPGEAQKLARRQWPMEAVPGSLMSELRTPEDFESVTEALPDDAPSQSLLCSSDPEDHLKLIREGIDAGYDNICVHQIGPKQQEFLRFYAEQVLPKVNGVSSAG
ncbi:MAG TPA: TIGR03557 family F420-dependent LLM class oxidoreductase [Actinomycetota bacterium]|nr:TIGR03557 family F420-dependent LLM class oxidoreductase [Actinomycetota bacterium]